MSSAVVSTSAALGRPFLFDDEAEAEVRPEQVRPFSSAKKPAHTQESAIATIQSTIKNQQSTISLTPASQLEIRPAPEMASSGIAALDALTGGLPRGCLTEICGPASSGRTTVLLAALAAATRRGEYCALIDASDSLDPHSIEAAGVDLDRLLWVRCGEISSQRHRATEKINSKHPSNDRIRSEQNLEQVLRSTDLLLESGGFGLIVLDLADLPPQSARRIPLTTWFRFRRAVEHKPTILLAIEQQPIAGSCSSLLLRLEAAKRRKNAAHGASRESGINNKQALEGRKIDHEQSILHDQTIPPTHANLLSGLDITAELTRSRLDRKPARSVAFVTKTAWAG